VTGSTVIGRALQSKTYAIGVELGFMVMENLWLSGGYNFYGYRDEDFANGEYTNKGTYLRLRYKFDEDLFPKAVKNSSPSTSEDASRAEAIPAGTPPGGSSYRGIVEGMKGDASPPSPSVGKPRADQ
jgi:hypothetical protein